MASFGCSPALSTAGWHRHMLTRCSAFGAGGDPKVGTLDPRAFVVSRPAGQLYKRQVGDRPHHDPGLSYEILEGGLEERVEDRRGSATSSRGTASPRRCDSLCSDRTSSDGFFLLETFYSLPLALPEVKYINSLIFRVIQFTSSPTHLPTIPSRVRSPRTLNHFHLILRFPFRCIQE